jgi:hypothetical protein
MADFGLDEEIATQLNTAWDITIIAKPVIWSSKQRGAPPNGNQIKVSEQPNSGRLYNHTWDRSAAFRDRQAEISLIGIDGSDAKKYILAITKALYAKTITGGFWKIESFDEAEKQDRRVAPKLRVRETRFVLSTEW